MESHLTESIRRRGWKNKRVADVNNNEEEKDTVCVFNIG